MLSSSKMKENPPESVISRIDRLVYPQQRRRSKTRPNDESKSTKAEEVGSSQQLQEAVFRGCIECISLLLESHTCSVDGPCGSDGLRPLHIAAREGHLHVLRYLTCAGASVQKCDVNGRSSLHYAAIGGQLRAVRWLLRHGAQITLDKRGRTPLHVASDLCHTEIVTLLTNHSACGTVSGGSKSSQDNSITLSSTTTILIKDDENQESKRRSGDNAENSFSEAQNQQESSSSGNFSLPTTVTSSGSNSPSSPSPSVCSCILAPDSSDNTTTVSSKNVPIIGPKGSKIEETTESELVSTPAVASFYLHPPRSPTVVIPRDTETPGSQGPSVTVSVAVEPFYLHPPRELNSTVPLIDSSEGSKKSVQLQFPEPEETVMGPVTPVNSSSEYLPSKDSHKEEKEESSPSTSTSHSPTPLAPPAKNGRVQVLKSAISPESPPTPPPPPPMPNLNQKPPSPCRGRNNGLDAIRNRLLNQENYGTNDNVQENDYEDIDDIQEDESHYEDANENLNRKLSRSVSVPVPPKMTEKETSPVMIQPKGIPPGSRRPFIPPDFPDPPKDALIKPSEYLKSIQQNKKYGKLGSGSGIRTLRPTNNSSRVEEVIKVLSGAEMQAVPEEPHAEEELNEVQAERTPAGSSQNVETFSGNIRSEELLKVNLRKTPMSRTRSAPPLGRVLPDQNENVVVVEQKRLAPATSSAMLYGKALHPGLPPRSAVIAELSESSQVGGVREWKEELRRRQIEEEKAAAKEIASVYSPLKFVAEIPEADESGVPIPQWKRQMMAKKAAEKAKKEAEEQRKLEAEAKRASAIPPWKRQLLQRRDADGKSAQ